MANPWNSLDSPPIADSGGEPDELLFEKLRSLRQEIATELAVPAYFVFPDETLRQMAIQLPADREALLRLKGVGPNKLQQFGERFLDSIAEHVEVHGDGASSASTETLAGTRGRMYVERQRDSYPRAYEKWLPEEDERLGRLFESGRSIPEIASELGRQPTAIESRLNSGPHLERVRQSHLRDYEKRHRRDTETDSVQSPPRAYEKWQPEEDERLARLFEAGRSIDEIASILGRQPSAIASRLRQTGMTTERRLYLSNTEAQTLELVRSGLNLAEVAARREIAPGTVLTHLERIAETEEALDLTHMLPPAHRYACIVEAFRAEDDDYLLSPVKQRLGDDYSYEELRLVRLRLRQLSTTIALSSSKFDILSTGQNP